MFLTRNRLLTQIESWNMNSIKLQMIKWSLTLVTFLSYYTIALCCVQIDMKLKKDIFSFASYITDFTQYPTFQLFC